MTPDSVGFTVPRKALWLALGLLLTGCKDITAPIHCDVVGTVPAPQGYHTEILNCYPG